MLHSNIIAEKISSLEDGSPEAAKILAFELKAAARHLRLEHRYVAGSFDDDSAIEAYDYMRRKLGAGSAPMRRKEFEAALNAGREDALLALDEVYREYNDRFGFSFDAVLSRRILGAFEASGMNFTAIPSDDSKKGGDDEKTKSVKQRVCRSCMEIIKFGFSEENLELCKAALAPLKSFAEKYEFGDEYKAEFAETLLFARKLCITEANAEHWAYANMKQNFERIAMRGEVMESAARLYEVHSRLPGARNSIESRNGIDPALLQVERMLRAVPGGKYKAALEKKLHEIIRGRKPRLA